MKKIVLSLILCTSVFTAIMAQTSSLPVIGTVLRGQVKNVVTSNSLQNEMRFTINNTGPVPLQFFVAATASAGFSGQGITVAAGQQRNVSVGELGGVSLGQYINVANNALSLFLPGAFTFDTEGSTGCATNAAPGTVYQKIGTNDYFFCDPVASINTSPIYRLGIGTSTPAKTLDVVGSGSFTSQLTVGGDISTSSNLSASGNILVQNGYVGIGTTNPGTCRLAVDGMIGAREVRVILGNFPDYVFAKDYKLRSLKEVEAYINKNHHLPGIQSATDVEANNGEVKLGELNAKLLEKVEELTLYAIEQNKKLEQLQVEMAKLKSEVKK